jgi:hypothetical protein
MNSPFGGRFGKLYSQIGQAEAFMGKIPVGTFNFNGG